jgi:hypothetical protein
VTHFFPQLGQWIRSLDDTRRQERCTYTRSFLAWMGLMLFVLKLSARRRIRFELNTAEGLANLNRLSQSSQQAVAHDGTLDHFLGHVHPGELDRKLRGNMVGRLIRMKALDYARLLGHFVIVLDGTGMLTFHHRHCPHCLTMTVAGQTIYYHHVLEAKLVTPDGLAFSVGSEFIENADPQATKQDCELKAFARLAPRLKKAFPQLLLCLCLDALYANGTVLDLCRQYHWKYFITFKEGSLPAVWQEYQMLLGLCPKNRKACRTGEGANQQFAWVNQLNYVDDRGREHTFAALQCHETEGDEKGFFAWITNFSIRPDNVAALANRGGRLRWKIENEGFNIQKNGGFALEHAYSYGDWQLKNFYLLLQVAHLILQLLEHGSLLAQPARKLFGSLAAMARRLAEALRNYLLPPDALDPRLRVRVSLDSS